MAFYEGSAMRIKVGTKTILHETDCEISLQTEMKEISTKDLAGLDVSPGKQSFSMSGNAYAANSDGTQEDIKTLLDAWKAKTKISLQLADGVSGNVTLSGDGYIESMKLTAPDGEAVKYDISIKGSGDVAIGTTA